MKKTFLKKILALTIVFMMFISTPISVFNISINSPYAYAATTFAQDLESELFEQTIIPTLIVAGLVFKTDYDWDKNNGSQLHEHIVTQSLKEYFENLGSDYKPPSDPDGPNLGETIKKILRGGTLVSVGYGLGKNIVEIPEMFWELVKSFVDDNYDVGENSIGGTIPLDYELNEVNGSDVASNTIKEIADGETVLVSLGVDYYNESSNLRTYNYSMPIKFTRYGNTNKFLKVVTFIDNNSFKITFGGFNSDGTAGYTNVYGYPLDNCTIYKYSLKSKTVAFDSSDNSFNDKQISVYGTNGIVDNSNYDWDNNYTDTKVIPIPIEMDPYGNPIKDENGNYLPSTDVDEWLDVQPTEIPELDPTGIPIPDIPEMPDIENPDDDEKTSILIYIGDVLKKIGDSLTSIGQDVKTIVMNTNQIVFGTSSPVFDPTTGEQIDPETGEPIVEPEPEPLPGDGIIGDGIDTNIPTDFEWGDFKYLLDIFFIFIYFIVILILILLKFLNVVFMSLPSIPANTELFNEYPEILEGVNFVKNLKVGGMSITVQQAFEMIFLIFFFIFAIKQIRKLYGASVFEQAAENKRNTKDMKMDYYENSQHYSPNNFSKGMLYSQQQDEIKKNKSLYNDDDYENIHFDGF